MQALVERFERRFTTQGIADQDDHKVDHVVDPETTTGKPDSLDNPFKHTKIAQVMGNNGYLPQP